MAVKGGQLIHVGNGSVVIDRIQTGGPNQVNVPSDKIYELGNYKSVATIYDTPSITFGYDSYDMSTEAEALLTGQYAGRTVDDGATTASSTSLTSNTASFASADVDRMVIVEGAGSDGADLVTTIDSVTDATTAVLADAATTAVTDATVTIVENGYDFAKSKPIDIASQFKAGETASSPFNVVNSVAVPFLALNSMSYKIGLHDNATQSATLQGDSIYYNPGAAFVEETAGTGTSGQTIATSKAAYETDDGDTRRVLAVSVGDKRLVFGVDYTESYGTITNGAAVTTITLSDTYESTDTIRIVYSGPSTVSYPQSTSPSATVKPAAIRGRDVEIYLGGYDPNDRSGSAPKKLSGLQSASVDWKVNITPDEELGSYYAVTQDRDVPETTGTLDFKPTDPDDFIARIRKLAGVTDSTKVVGASQSTAMDLDIVIKNPETKKVIKRLHVEDARFTVPGYQGQVQQQMTVSLPFSSDEGSLLAYAR